MSADRGATPAIDVRDLTKHFGGRKVVDKVSLRVERGEIHGFLGPNGSGKTTSIRLMCGLLTPDSGSGRCLGFDILRERAAIKRDAYRKEEDALSAKYNSVARITGRSLTFRCKTEEDLKALIKALSK